MSTLRDGGENTNGSIDRLDKPKGLLTSWPMAMATAGFCSSTATPFFGGRPRFRGDGVLGAADEGTASSFKLFILVSEWARARNSAESSSTFRRCGPDEDADAFLFKEGSLKCSEARKVEELWLGRFPRGSLLDRVQRRVGEIRRGSSGASCSSAQNQFKILSVVDCSLRCSRRSLSKASGTNSGVISLD